MTQLSLANWKRFLLTGCDSGMYRAAGYAPDPARSRAFLHFLSESGPKAVGELLDFEHARPDARLYALALAASPRFAAPETVAAAFAALPLAARKAQDLAAFAAYATSFRGWGRGLRGAIASWYANQPVDDLAAQILKRPSRNLRQHRALVRRAHPKAGGAQQNALFQWIADGRLGHLASPEVLSGGLRRVDGYERARSASSERDIVHLVEDYRLHPPQIAGRWKKSPRVWEALFDHLSYRQTLRYLPAMTASGLLTHGSDYSAIAVARVADRARLRAAGVSPLRILQAMKRYRASHRAVEGVFDALDEAFHLSLANTPPLGKRIVAAVDATGSMQGAPVLGMPHVPAALAGAALVLTLARAEGRDCLPVAFHREARLLSRCSGKDARLAGTLNEIRATPSRGDPSSVIRFAASNRVEASAFVIVTDRLSGRDAETLGAEVARYRERMGIASRLVLVNLSGGVEIDAPDGAMVVSGLDTHRSLVAIRAFLQDA
jgi:60 kDa SS-A/Ro ribonucleoprotein